MFSIKFRRKGATSTRRKRFGISRHCPDDVEKKGAEPLHSEKALTTTSTANDMNLSVEYFVDDDRLDDEGPPDLLEESFTSNSSDADDDSSFSPSLNSCSMNSGRRVSFLLPPGAEKSNRCPIVPRSSAFSAESLLKGEIPLSKPQRIDEFDVSSASIPGNKIWLVGKIPEIPEEEETDSDDSQGDDIEEMFCEDVPFDEVKPKTQRGKASVKRDPFYKSPSCDDNVPFDERCDCCVETPSPSCAICQNVRVFETSPGCWHISSNNTRLTISLPPSTTLKTALKRNIVIDSDLPEDLSVYVDEKDVKGWNVESFLFVLVQLVLLKVTASI